MPAPGVDPSWALGLNQAVAQGLAFGKEIIFTLGPYAAIYTKFYHPATDSMMLWGSLYLACAYYLALLLLMQHASWSWRFIFSGFLLTLVYAKDALFFSYPLLVGLLVFHEVQREQKSINYRALCVFIFLASPLGLLPLIKGSLLIISGVISGLSALTLFYKRRFLLGAVLLFSPFLSLLLFWLLAGQHLANLSPYFMSSLNLALSFTDAMSLQGNGYEVISYLILTVFVLLLVSKAPLPKLLTLFLFSLFFVFLFLSFKAGFTRHFGHAFIAGTSLLIAVLLLPYCIRSKWLAPLVVLAFIISFYIEGHYRQFNLLKNMQSTYATAWYGWISRLNDTDWLKNNFRLSMSYLKIKNAFPLLKGTSDIYSYEQTDLIASGNTWLPRPVLQSYSVFNVALAKVNEQHLLGPQKPDNIFFKMQPIDNRWPSLEDGNSWPIFLKNYQIATWINDFLLLHKAQLGAKPSFKQIAQETHSLGETVHLPTSQQMIFLRLELEPNVLGKLFRVLFKLPELSITARLRNGSEKRYRLIAEMAKAHFLLSPLIENTQEFASLYDNEFILQGKQLVSFRIDSANEVGGGWLWSPHYVAQLNVLL
ncbi:hypothetical protein [Legionella sp. km772]|uniref:hypothetical protein n=1 Tax=Legionella sp. km772 TaxID=2498111 RepID=UPI000F8CE18B|nr:hypothetical protein [Legionella sp. km772]RUR05418.1 hypothetical protein ELY15_14335 [Legionella sp. km772]